MNMKPNMMGAPLSKQALMNQINETSFAIDEVLLFLDTHPNDMAALDYYRNAVAVRRQAMDIYQSQFGPLMADGVYGNRWNWINDPWPWEGGC